MIQGNYIGTNAAGTGALANGTGILADQSTNLTIGGTASGDGNLIAFNSGVGVSVSSASSRRANTGEFNLFQRRPGDRPGVGGDAQAAAKGVTSNDTGDADTGANNLQNFPLLTYATILDDTLTVHGSLNSTANTSLPHRGLCQRHGRRNRIWRRSVYLGSFNVTTDSAGNVNFDNCGGANVFNVSVAPGKNDIGDGHQPYDQGHLGIRPVRYRRRPGDYRVAHERFDHRQKRAASHFHRVAGKHARRRGGHHREHFEHLSGNDCKRFGSGFIDHAYLYRCHQLLADRHRARRQQRHWDGWRAMSFTPSPPPRPRAPI